jgi:hypothetical protein
MRFLRLTLVLAATWFAATSGAQEMTALSCKDFRPTNEALERFPNLAGACEGIVDRDGELYGKFTAVVRRVSGNNLTLHLPATNRTFKVRPDSSHRVLVDGRKTRARDLVRGQELQIYLSVKQFAAPDIEQVAFVTETDMIVDLEIEEVAALPTTASLQKPARVITSTIRSTAIVEAVNKETREIKLLDASGERFTIVADEMVRNFDQIEPRDRVYTEYLESVAIMVAPAEAPTLAVAPRSSLRPWEASRASPLLRHSW